MLVMVSLSLSLYIYIYTYDLRIQNEPYICIYIYTGKPVTRVETKTLFTVGWLVWTGWTDEYWAGLGSAY